MILARSVDGGRTYRNYAWTQTASDAQGAFIGDYTGIAALNGRVYGVWTERPTEIELASARKVGHAAVHNTLIRVGIADFGNY